MSTTRATPKRARISLDRSIERLRKQLADLAAYLGRGPSHPQPWKSSIRTPKT
jgi:hypothetical protein